jgi:hypothetical protein
MAIILISPQRTALIKGVSLRQDKCRDEARSKRQCALSVGWGIEDFTTQTMSYTTDSKYPTKQMADVLQKSLLQS